MYRSSRSGILIHANIVKKFSKDYLCVLGGGDINMARYRMNGYPDKDGMYISEEQTSVSAIHAASNLGETVVSRFFMYTPELMLSWLTCEDIKTLVKCEKATLGITGYNIKPFIFHKLWPEMEPRPKFTGYENVDLFQKEQWSLCDPTLLNIMKDVMNTNFHNTTINIEYSDLINLLFPNENTAPILQS